MINLAELDTRKIIIIMIIALAIIYGDIAYIIKLQFKHNRDNKQKIVQLQSQVDALVRELAAMNKARAQTKQERAAEIKAIISQEQIPSLLENISSIANKNKVKIMRLSPAKEAADQTSGVSQMQPFLIVMELDCDYHSCGTFINDLENADQFLAVQELKINAGSGDSLKQNIRLAIKTYVKK